MNEELQVEERGTTERPIFPKSILAVAGDPIYEDESETGAGTGWIALLVLLVLAFLAWDVWRMWQHYLLTHSIWKSLDYASIAFVLFALYYLIGQARAVYRFRLTDNALVVEYQGLFGLKHHEIPYENIYGVHLHKARLANNVKFRYKWRWYSLTDGRPLLAMFYKIPRPGKLPQYGRVLFKAEPEFQLAMNEYLPGRIGITEEETTYHVLVDEGYARDALAQAKAARKKVSS